ncbi:hypothetical protein FQA39_LY03309 [Lamprigera yunnana]|nr:hypothetical protein FQA39_LY03309 [Lamprigera yunnana]
MEENNQKLDKTRTEIRTEMDQSIEKIEKQFLTIQERINKKREKKYVEVDCKMVEIQEQVNNNSGKIIGICERLREEGTKLLINVEAKINQDKEEKIQACEDLKEQNREIMNYIEEKIKIGNGTGHNVITNYSKLEREAVKFHPSKNQHPKVALLKEINFITITIIETKNIRTIGDGMTTETGNMEIHRDIENRQRKEEIKESFKDMKLKMRIIDQMEEM